jgi:hypothetical protein
MRRPIAGIVAILIAVGWLWFVWPTPYRYLSPWEGRATRMNRFTEQIQLLTTRGWLNVPVKQQPANPFDTLPGRR